MMTREIERFMLEAKEYFKDRICINLYSIAIKILLCMMLWVCIGSAADSTQRSLHQKQYPFFPDESTEAILLQKTKALIPRFLHSQQESYIFAKDFSQEQKQWYKEVLHLLDEGIFELEKNDAKKGLNAFSLACEKGLEVACLEKIKTQYKFIEYAKMAREDFTGPSVFEDKEYIKHLNKLQARCVVKKAYIDSGFSCMALNKFFREEDFERFNDTYKDLVKEVAKLRPSDLPKFSVLTYLNTRACELGEPTGCVNLGYSFFMDLKKSEHKIIEDNNDALAAIFQQRIDTMTAQLFQSACLQGFGLYCAMFADEFYGASWFKFAIMGISNYYDNSQQEASQKKVCEFLQNGCLLQSANACYYAKAYQCSQADVGKSKKPKSKKGLPYFPQNRDELVALINDKRVDLAKIDTSAITDMSFLFANHLRNQYYPVFDDPEGRGSWAKAWLPGELCGGYQDHREVFRIDWLYYEGKINEIRRNNFKQWDIIKFQCYKENGGKRKNLAGIESWDTSNVKDMKFMFYRREDFNLDITKWDTSKVKNMAGMFSRATSFSQNINLWDTSSLKYNAGMAYKAKELEKIIEQNAEKWDKSGVIDHQQVIIDEPNY
ncbi:BspA family leucine-rich repeat surface protein [Helicobacter bilis]|uniref:BspA family leucine-rich repeat surface protein n=1 Tax=Helicobacter bilis TaxID=37372 RepID=UPI0026EEF3DB|nr:BspA family leucine-rich repeat surface protein [Helicobacter bilis]